ncbi:MAG: post-transcriptional regulator [Clostridium sp.]|nr:post-transcriptional regulator [Clostridium sp.]MCM1444027.1 post-transcriptional regulator [Candidatus Amulumruptor caecigallinarius]
MDVAFNSLQELYDRIKPALTTKKEEMKRYGITYIKEEDIWNYFKETKWKSSSDLSLFQMVSDILDTDYIIIEDYFKEKIRKEIRHINLED